jgi:hypothetical protein
VRIVTGIFLSYRRDDSSPYAGRLYDRLSERFGRDNIFMDIDTIALGFDFVEVVRNAVGSCEVLLAVIGRQWLTSTDPQGQRRLDNPEDFVHLEIVTALTRNIRVIPVLVGGASMPGFAELPDVLQPLAHRQALVVGNHFHPDIDCLITTLETVLASTSSTLSGNREAYAEEIEGWICPHCQSTVRYDQRVCLGCQAEVVYGSTKAEQEEAAKTGLMLGGGFSVLLFLIFPKWLSSYLPWQVPVGLGLGIFAFFVAVFLTLLVVYSYVQYEDNRHRKSPPRFFRSSVT